MSRKLFTVALAALPLWTQAAVAQEQDEPKQLGTLFCVLTQGGEQFAPQYLLTASLVAEIQAGLKKNDEWAAANPGDKPPLGDGIHFASYPDGAPICRVDAIADAADGKTHVDIQYVVGATREANWTDRLVLKSEGGLLHIDDVLYGTSKYDLGLRRALADAFQN